MANVLKVFLENGQTKSFKYDSTTTVQVNDNITPIRNDQQDEDEDKSEEEKKAR